ncbi:fibronectin type III domain-containing protein [Leptospira terpstrae]|uniref:Fibronectin type III domain protein n=1 Tax=Leptospira terpstrae serovar Hualin str. LT 11-33 = ATCC 700639 TaxID=1257025 RepID=N1VW63_9LEPT|nr:fibronectin type III domain protein [Leptospira terpstrae]EMY61022.1 fibronectin type III domain protein [Leptospira terpstrae serovar Hualin str. LT 11-33 = ATCC 700639]
MRIFKKLGNLKVKKILSILIISQFMVSCIAFLDFSKEADKKLETLGIVASSVANVGSATAGPSGKTIASEDGQFEVLIPPGAMEEEKTFTIKRYTLAPTSLPNGYIPTTDAYEITPSYRFKKDVVISITQDTGKIEALNLVKQRSQGFIYTTTSDSDNSGRVSGGWDSSLTTGSSDKLQFQSRTFSIFGGGTPPPGNGAPNIVGAFYDFKPSSSFLPFRVRAQVIEPDGDSMSVYLVTGPVGQGTVAIRMTPEPGNWYSALIPYESMIQAGIQIQVLAVDVYGNNTTRPSSDMFLYPASSGNPAFVSNYDTDKDNDGYLDAWEIDNGFNPNSASSPNAASFPDTDLDGIPNVADHTPNGEFNPQIDSLTVIPNQARMYLDEKITFSILASYLGSPRYVRSTFVTTGNGLSGTPVGEFSTSVFQAIAPGIAGVQVTVGSFQATSTVTVIDTLPPNDITTLTATAMSTTRVRLRWQAPGNDGPYGKVSAYEIRRSAANIDTDAKCSSASTIFHTLTPKNAGSVEIWDANGHSPNTTYYYCIRAYDHNGNRNEWVSSNVSATTYAVSDTIRPSDVTTLTATAMTNETVQLSWTAVGDDGNTGNASSYEIRRSASVINTDLDCDNSHEVTNSISSVTVGTNVNFLVTQLSADTRYYFCVRGYDEVGNKGKWNGIVSATTMLGNLPPIVNAGPDQLNAMASTPVTLNGSQSYDPDSGVCSANPASYVYQWNFISKPPTSNLTNAQITNGNQLNASFIPDVAGMYTLELTFTDSSSTCYGGPRMGTDFVQIMAYEADLIAPAQVTSFLGTGISQDQIQLTWLNVGDDGMTGNINRYEIGISITPMTTVSDCQNAPWKHSPNINNFVPNAHVATVIGGLFQNTTYYVCIVGLDEVGNRGQANLGITVTTLAGTSGWGAWTAWSDCSANCGFGTHSRSRICLDPIAGCGGTGVETASCQVRPCMVNRYISEPAANGTSATVSCPAGYTRGPHMATNHYPGSYTAHVWGDYWGEGWACGAIFRGSFVNQNPTAYSVSNGTNSATFYFSDTNPPPPPNYCVTHELKYNRSVGIYCSEDQH